MQSNLVKATANVWEGLRGAGIVVTETGLVVKDKLALDDFTKAFKLLLFLDDRYKVFINFALGDLYNALDLQHGEKKAQITDTWGEGWYNRLSTLGGVAARIPKFSRLNYELAWHVYESAAKKYIPEEIRTSMLQTAAEQKRSGKYVSRDTLRDSTSIYKPPSRPKAQPAWNGGKGGKFGDNADAVEPPQAEKPGAESSTEPSPFEGQPEKGGESDVVEVKNELQEEMPAQARGQANAALLERLDSREQTSVEAQNPGSGEGGDQGDGGQIEELRGSCPDMAPTMSQQLYALQEENESLRTELQTLKAKLTGIWELSVELDDDHMKALDKIVKHRRSKFPKDEIDRQTEVQAAIRRRWDEIKRSHKAKE